MFPLFILVCFVPIPLFSHVTSGQIILGIKSDCRTINRDSIQSKRTNPVLDTILQDFTNAVITTTYKVTETKEHLFLNKNYDEPKDCSEIQNQGYKISGVYTIYPDACLPKINVYCDLTTEGGGWLVIQRRMDGSENFYRHWSDYKFGFGLPSREFWLGNDIINLLTNQQKYELMFELEDYEGNKVYARYQHFSIAPETFKYKLSVSGFSGNAGDSFSGQNNMYFTTQDQDNDIYGKNCAVEFKAAWWYSACHGSNLNGLYVPGGNHTSYADGINWSTFKGLHYSLKWTEMKIRPLAFKSTSKIVN